MSAVPDQKGGGKPSPAERLHELFSGAEGRHGTYDKHRCRRYGDKLEMKDENGNGARELKSAPTPELWQQHLDGERPLGVSPLREDGMCRWGVVDSDDYSLTPLSVMEAAQRADLPVVVCRSKSGGAHVFLFADDWVPQATMHAALMACRDTLGVKKGEIFPTAATPGNWLNMPYFGGDETDRYAVKAGGLEMSVAEFLVAAEAKKVSAEVLARLSTLPANRRRSSATDQQAGAERAHRDLERFVAEMSAAPKGIRGKLLYGRAKDLGKMVGARWIDRADVSGKLLTAGMACGLDMKEASEHIRNGIEHGMKETPDDEPDADRYPKIESIVVLVGGEEEMWRLSLAGLGDITLPVREVMHYYTFNTRCAARLRTSFRQLKNDAWSDRINEALRHATEEQVPRDETPEWVFFEEMCDFCMDRQRSECLDDIHLGKPIHAEDEDRVYFTVSDLQTHLAKGSTILRSASLRRIGALLNGLGAENVDTGKTTKRVRGKLKELRWVRLSLLDKTEALELPPLPGVPL